jgi:hypothetical protein
VIRVGSSCAARRCLPLIIVLSVALRQQDFFMLASVLLMEPYHVVGLRFVYDGITKPSSVLEL